MPKIDLDTSKLPLFAYLEEGKRNEKITFTGSEELKKAIYDFANKQGVTVSDLCARYIIKGLSTDMEKMLLIKEYQDRPLSEVLKMFS
jgi:hypothetical protein